MFFGLNKKIANEMHVQLFERSVWKVYYCRVAGRFPEGEVTVDKPILTISPKHGLNRLREDGKPSCTVFERVFYDEKRDQSVVLAKPLTGRTHQIRYIPVNSEIVNQFKSKLPIPSSLLYLWTVH